MLSRTNAQTTLDGIVKVSDGDAGNGILPAVQMVASDFIAIS